MNLKLRAGCKSVDGQKLIGFARGIINNLGAGAEPKSSLVCVPSNIQTGRVGHGAQSGANL